MCFKVSSVFVLFCLNLDRYGKGQLHYPLPDFSQVEPRVHFPKEGYKPPKSKGCPRKKSPRSEKPLVFKSPADIVREVLSSADASLFCPAPPTPAGPLGPHRALDATVPQEFRSPRQASALVHQLQVGGSLTHNLLCLTL